MPIRRHVVAGLAGLAAFAPSLARAEVVPLTPDGNQTQALQSALLANASGRISLPPGRFVVYGLSIPGNVVIEGVPGATWLIAAGSAVGTISGQSNVVLRDIGFVGDSGSEALLGIEAAQGVVLERCSFRESPGVALGIHSAAVTVRDCDFLGHGDAAIHAMDSRGLVITGNRIAKCGNAGVRVWRSVEGPDGSIIVNNRISEIDWRGGGNGQNGNGINVFRADEVIVADNHISDCAFTAVRLNTTKNTQISGNVCRDCGEVAIFSEFAFSGSVVANNVVDGAATGISITNLDSGGQIAVCTGNIVRNITPKSAVNPDTIPIGIFVEAETTVTGNVVANVPGAGIAAGWGPFLRNVVVSSNVVSDCTIGIGVSVVEDAGAVMLSTNQVGGSYQHAIAGMRWTEVTEPDLLANVGRYPHVTLG